MNFNIATQQISNETVQTVNAQELHKTLGVARDFSTWIKGRIKQYCFIENQDYTTKWNVLKNINISGKRGGSCMLLLLYRTNAREFLFE